MRRRIERGFLSLMDRIALAWEGMGLAGAHMWRRAAPLRAAIGRQARRTREYPLSWCTLYVAVICALCIAFIDKPLALWLKDNVEGNVQGFFKVVTRLGEAEFYLVGAGILWIVLMIAGIRAADPEARARWRRLSFSPAFLFLSITVSGLISNLLKFSIGRYRPRYLFNEGLYGLSPFNTQWGMNSFPSGHSQAAFAAMIGLMIIFPRYDVFWILIAILVAASRVVTTVHYLSDTIAGGYLAIAMAVLLARFFRSRGIDPRIRLPHDHLLK